MHASGLYLIMMSWPSEDGRGVGVMVQDVNEKGTGSFPAQAQGSFCRPGLDGAKHSP
jgi:hypothetical protein